MCPRSDPNNQKKGSCCPIGKEGACVVVGEWKGLVRSHNLDPIPNPAGHHRTQVLETTGSDIMGIRGNNWPTL